MWPDGWTIFQYLATYNDENLRNKQYAKAVPKFCQILNILSLNCKTLKFLQQWRKYDKSGHTAPAKPSSSSNDGYQTRFVQPFKEKQCPIYNRKLQVWPQDFESGTNYYQRLYAMKSLVFEGSVTTWLDHLFNIWPFTTMKICPTALNQNWVVIFFNLRDVYVYNLTGQPLMNIQKMSQIEYTFSAHQHFAQFIDSIIVFENLSKIIQASIDLFSGMKPLMLTLLLKALMSLLLVLVMLFFQVRGKHGLNVFDGRFHVLWRAPRRRRGRSCWRGRPCNRCKQCQCDNFLSRELQVKLLGVMIIDWLINGWQCLREIDEQICDNVCEQTNWLPNKKTNFQHYKATETGLELALKSEKNVLPF